MLAARELLSTTGQPPVALSAPEVIDSACTLYTADAADAPSHVRAATYRVDVLGSYTGVLVTPRSGARSEQPTWSDGSGVPSRVDHLTAPV